MGLRLVGLVVAVLAGCAAPAAAHDSPTSRVHDMRHVAAGYFGPGVCGDTMSDGSRDVHHSSDPRSVMWALGLDAYFAPCAPFASR
jgi:hypothetical protein